MLGIGVRGGGGGDGGGFAFVAHFVVSIVSSLWSKLCCIVGAGALWWTGTKLPWSLSMSCIKL